MNNIIKRTWRQGSMVIIEDLRGVAFQAEENGHTFEISAIDRDGELVALSGTPAGVMLRCDNQDVALTCAVSDGKVTATLPANAYAVPGRFALTIFLTSGGQKVAIYAAVGTVKKTNSGTVAPPAGDDVTDLISRINTAINAIPVNYNAAFAVAYENLPFPVTEGTYCIYDGALKRAVVDIATSETYTAAHWTNANFGQDLNSLKSALVDVGYRAEMSVLLQWVPFHAKAGDKITLKTVDGSNFTATKFELKRANGTTDWWTLNTSTNSKDLTVGTGEEFFYVRISGGTAQPIYVINNSSYYNWHGEVDTLKTDLKNTQDKIGYYQDKSHTGYLLSDGTYGGTSSFHSLTTEKIQCTAGDIFNYKGYANANACSALFYNGNTISSVSHSYKLSDFIEITIPSGCDGVVFSSFESNSIPVVLDVRKKGTVMDSSNEIKTILDENNQLEEKVNSIEDVIFENMSWVTATPASTVDGLLKKDGTIEEASSWKVKTYSISRDNEPYIKVSSQMPANANYLGVLFLNSNNVIISYYQAAPGTSYESIIQIPEGTETIKIGSSGNAGTLYTIKHDISGTVNLKDADNYLINLMSYRPLGVLSKGYMCLSSDDGHAPLATHTIPILQELAQTYGDIPFTFALMSDSGIFDNATYTQLVASMVQSHKCCVASHGSTSYASYTAAQLINFLELLDAEIYTKLGVHPKAVIYPMHVFTTKIATIAGSFYGVCGDGYGDEVKNKYNYFTAGERTNLYTLPRFSLMGSAESLSAKKTTIKNAIDYCVANNKLILPFMHDTDLSQGTDDWTAEECQEILRYTITYGKSAGITFINFGDIPNII